MCRPTRRLKFHWRFSVPKIINICPDLLSYLKISQESGFFETQCIFLHNARVSQSFATLTSTSMFRPSSAGSVDKGKDPTLHCDNFLIIFWITMKMNFITVRKIRQMFLGILMTTVFAAVLFYSRILFARDAFVRTYMTFLYHYIIYSSEMTINKSTTRPNCI